MADLPSSGAGENESAPVEGEAAAGQHVVVQIDEKPVEVVEQAEDAVHAEEEVKEEKVKEEEIKEEVKEEAVAVTEEGESERVEGGEGVMGEEGDRDSLVPGTGSINGDLDEEEEEEEESDEDGDEENMGNVVQGTTETILNKLEENLSQAPPVAEGDLLQVYFCWIALIFL